MNFPKLKMLPVIYKQNECFLKVLILSCTFIYIFYSAKVENLTTDIVLPGKCKSLKDESNNHLWLSQKIQFLKKKRIKYCIELYLVSLN
jgi:hypothetical protein